MTKKIFKKCLEYQGDDVGKGYGGTEKHKGHNNEQIIDNKRSVLILSDP